MVAAFPLAKLFYLGIKQISKPIVKSLQARALNSPVLRKFVCSPPAQLLHRLEVFVKMRMMGATGPTQVKALSDDKAVELGAEIIGELIVFSMASSAILYEYYRSVRKGQAVEETQDQKISKLNDRLRKLDRELNIVKRTLHKLEDSKQTTPSKG